VTSGGTCSGPDDYSDLRWRLDAQGRLVSLLNGQCVAVAANGSLTTTAAGCSSAPGTNQTWSYDAGGSGALRLVGSNLCLTAPAPPPPPVAYAQLCGRIQAYNGMQAVNPPGGYCLALNAAGAWTLTAGAGAAAVRLAAGNVSAAGGGFDSRWPSRLGLSMHGSKVAATINGSAVATTVDNTAAFGLAALGSGYHAAVFDDFAATAA